MREVRIIYAGAPLAGCLTSLGNLIRKSTGRSMPVGELLDLQRNERQVGILVEGRYRSLSARVASRRARLSYSHGEEITADPALSQEVQAIIDSDGVVFVVDSQAECLVRNRDAFHWLQLSAATLGRSLDEIPVLFQANKRDLPSAAPISEVETWLQHPRCAWIESVATQGVGIMEAVQTLVRLIDWDEVVSK